MNRMTFQPNKISIVTLPLAKWLFAAATAAVTTISLIALMHILIAGPKLDIPAAKSRPIVDFLLVERVIENQVIAPLPPKPPVVEVAPTLPVFNPEKIIGGSTGLVGFRLPAPVIGEKLSVATSAFPIAKMMVSPDYPTRAVSNGIEGFVDVRFDITKTGATKNVEVIAAEPEKIFDRSAVNAIKRWKYSPFERDGEVVEYLGMSRRVVFQLEK